MARLQFSLLLWLETLLEVVPSLLQKLKWLHHLSGPGILSCAASRLITATGQALPGCTFPCVLMRSHLRNKLIIVVGFAILLKPTL